MTKYVVCRCHKTKTLADWLATMGNPHSAWIPLLNKAEKTTWCSRMRSPVACTTKCREGCRRDAYSVFPAIYGYVYVPQPALRVFQRSVPGQFRIKPMYIGPTNRMAVVDLKELKGMQEALSAKPVYSEMYYKVGEEAVVKLGPLSGWHGKVVGFRNGCVKILINGRVFSMSKTFLSK